MRKFLPYQTYHVIFFVAITIFGLCRLFSNTKTFLLLNAVSLSPSLPLKITQRIRRKRKLRSMYHPFRKIKGKGQILDKLTLLHIEVSNENLSFLILNIVRFC